MVRRTRSDPLVLPFLPTSSSADAKVSWLYAESSSLGLSECAPVAGKLEFLQPRALGSGEPVWPQETYFLAWASYSS